MTGERFPQDLTTSAINRSIVLLADDGTKPGNITIANVLGQILPADITGLATVAKTGSYLDLTNRPNVGAGGITSGTIDNTTIGATTPASAVFTTLSATGDLSGLVTSTGSNTARSLANRFSDVVNVLDYGADKTGGADSTTAFVAALATGNSVYVPHGNYKITNALTLNSTTFGQKMYGDGRTQSLLQINSTTFNLSALGVIVFGSVSDNGAILRDIGITFTQPQQTLRASLVAFPPAIYAQGAGRFQIDRVRINAANVGLDASTGCGGSFIDTFEVGALTTGMIWDNAQDAVHWTHLHFWNFGVTGTLLTSIYQDGTTVAASIGRIDGLLCSGFETYLANVTFTSNAGTSTDSHQFDNMTLDTGKLTVQGSTALQIGNLNYVSNNTATNSAIVVTAGRVYIGQAFIATGTTSTSPSISVSGGSLLVGGGYLAANAPGQNALTVSGGTVDVNNLIFRPANSTYTVPYVTQSGTGALRVYNSVFAATGGTGIGIAISVANAQNIINGIIWNAFTFQLPGSIAGAANHSLLYTSTGTYIPTPGVTFIDVYAVGSGGGGGGGALTASGTACSGGAGGGGGFQYIQSYRYSDLPATIAITINAGGAGGAASTTNATGGSPGAIGGTVSFGSFFVCGGGGGGEQGEISAASAGGGGGGILANGTTGAANVAGAAGLTGGAGGISGAIAGTVASPGGGSGGGSCSNVGVAASGGYTYYGGPGGSAGGGVTTAPASNNGAITRFATSIWATTAAGGTSGTPAGGTLAALKATLTGSGGGGGYGNSTGVAGIGGAGTNGGGGGGGGSALNGSTSGTGGVGGTGFVFVKEHF